MAVTIDDVKDVLEPDEPDYQAAAKLGPDALPHLQALVEGDDPMLASKAAYAASLLAGSKGKAVVMAAAVHDDPTVRVAAGAAARNLPAKAASDVLLNLVADHDAGVRKVARGSVPDSASRDLTAQLEEAPASGTESLNIGGLMPGEAPGDATGADQPGTSGLMPDEQPGTTGTMPGERAGLMPGEKASGSGSP